MSLDLDQVQTFVAAAEARHFGRAATRLHLTQQGVSRRITALERHLGVRLFRRRPGGVELSPEGDRFLSHARRLLDLADAAVESVDPASCGRALRVDVWGSACRPLRLLREHVGTRAQAPVEVSMRRNSEAALAALRRGDIDVAFVCAATLPGESTGLESGVACTEQLAAGIPLGHPLAGRDRMSATELREYGLWWPVRDAPDMSRQITDYAAVNGIPILADGQSMGVEFVLDSLVDRPDRIGLYGADWPTDHVERVRIVPIEDPAPLIVWSLVWRSSRPHPELDRLRRSISDQERDRRIPS